MIGPRAGLFFWFKGTCSGPKGTDGCKYGEECQKALNNIAADESKHYTASPENDQIQADHADFLQLRKTGEPKQHALILSSRKKTASSCGSGKKRQSTFDLTSELEEMRVEQVAASGAKLAYMHYERWLKVAKKKHNLSMAEFIDHGRVLVLSIPKPQSLIQGFECHYEELASSEH